MILNNDVPTLGYLETLFGSLVSALLGLAAIGLFLTLIAGGFKYISSGGDPKGLESAKMTLTYAIVGLVLVMGAFLVIYFLEQFTGASLTNFYVVLP